MNRLISVVLIATGVILLNACQAPVTLTSWKNPSNNAQISKVAVMPIFEKLEFMKPFEQSMVAYFNSGD